MTQRCTVAWLVILPAHLLRCHEAIFFGGAATDIVRPSVPHVLPPKIRCAKPPARDYLVTKTRTKPPRATGVDRFAREILTRACDCVERGGARCGQIS